MNEQGTRWTTTIKYVDIDTGELIRNYRTQKGKEYITIKIKKEIKYNDTKTQGTVEYTKLCRRNPQTRLSL